VVVKQTALAVEGENFGRTTSITLYSGEFFKIYENAAPIILPFGAISI
jgi:hypothetical protein